MEPKVKTKTVLVPFNPEMAKRIQAGEVKGEIYDSHYNCNARIVDFNFKTYAYGKLNIGVSHLNMDEEKYFICNNKGAIFLDGENKFDDTPVIKLKIPEYLTFKDGDVVTMGWESEDGYCTWVSVIKGIDEEYEILTENYATVCLDASEGQHFNLSFDDSSDSATWAVKATEDEIKKLVEELEKSKDPRAVECLNRFFPKSSPILSNFAKIGKKVLDIKYFVTVPKGYGDKIWHSANQEPISKVNLLLIEHTDGEFELNYTFDPATTKRWAYIENISLLPDKED